MSGELRAGMYVVAMFPDELIALNEEIAHPAHHELHDRLAEQEATEIEIRIATVAMYCDIVLDGYYTVQDMVRLCGILTHKLRERRASILLPYNGGLTQ